MSNRYRSLHTVIMCDDVHPFEVQIRTKEMHLQAEFGFAAHWRYKEGGCSHSFVLQMVEWARWVLTWQCEAMSKERPLDVCSSDSINSPCPFPLHSEECPYSYTRQYNHDGPIFVIMLQHDKVALHGWFLSYIYCWTWMIQSDIIVVILVAWQNCICNLDVCSRAICKLNNSRPDGAK